MSQSARQLLAEWRETYGGSTHRDGRPVSADLEARTDALLAQSESAPQNMAKVADADRLVELICARLAPKPAEIMCPRARSDMTPCIARDGSTAQTTDECCVGCGMAASELLAKEAIFAPSPANARNDE